MRRSLLPGRDAPIAALARAFGTGCALLVSFAAAPAQAEPAQATARAVIEQGIAVDKLNELEFGILIAGSAPGTATIDPATNARTLGDLTSVGSWYRAHFVSNGIVGLTVNASVDSTVTLVPVSGGGPPMVADLSFVAGNGIGSVTLPFVGKVSIVTLGTQDYYVGGTLHVAGNQPDGDYVGTFTFTVNYL